MTRFFGVMVLFYLGQFTLAFAQGTAVPGGAPATGAAAPGAPEAPGFGSMLLPFAMMFGVVYFLMIRPQQKRAKEQQDMLSKLTYGDDIITTSGLLGKITGIADKVVTIEIADDVRVKMLKSQVSQVVKGNLKDTVLAEGK